MKNTKFLVERLYHLKKRMEELEIQLIFFNDNLSLRYLYGFKILSDFNLIISLDHEDLLIVPMLEYERCKDHLKDFNINIINFSSYKEMNEVIDRLNQKYNFNKSKFGLFYDKISLSNYTDINKKYILFNKKDSSNSKNIKFSELDTENIVNIGSILDEMRECKYDDEIKSLKRACKIGDLGMKKGIESLDEGITEIEIAAIIENEMRKNGAEGPAFDTIVASGINSSYPHAGATDKVINKGEIVTIDMGAIYNGYYSDMTRSVLVGSVPFKEEFIKIINTINEAEKQAYEALKPGVECYKIDKIARKYLKSHNNWDKYFVHGLGHGLGLEVHDKVPRLSPGIEYKLKPGMVVTVEPGVYIPGLAGARTEDSFVITDDGYEKITNHEVFWY